MSSADRKNQPPKPDPAAQSAEGSSSAPPASLSDTMRTGSAFKSTWRMPSIRPSSGPGQSGVRRLDPADLPPPSSGRTLHDLFSAPPGPMPAEPATRSEPSPRSGGTLTDLPSAPPPGAPRGDWVRQVPVGPRSWNEAEAGRHDRITDPMGSTRLSPEDLLPKSAPPPRQPQQREQPAAAAEVVRESSPTAQPARVVESTTTVRPSDAAQRARVGARRSGAPAPREPRPQQQGGLPWVLIASSVVLVACLGGFAYWQRTRPEVVDQNVNVVLPLVQAPAEAEPTRTSIKVAERTSLADAPEAPSTAGADTASNRVIAANQTLIESTPSGAEIVLRGAVIANTPALLALPQYEDEYLLRKSAFSPELIRIGPNSPRQIKVELKAAAQ